MRDFSLKFADKQAYRAFLDSVHWYEDESLQEALLLDEIGTTYTGTGRYRSGDSDGNNEENEIVEANDGWFVNVRVIDDSFDTRILEPYCVELAAPVRVWC